MDPNIPGSAPEDRKREIVRWFIILDVIFVVFATVWFFFLRGK
jgi:hypothetical protein